MKLKIKSLEWSTGLFGAMIHTKTAKRLGVSSADRILIKTNNDGQKNLVTFVNTINRFVKEDEIVVSSETKSRLRLKEGQKVEIILSQTPNSLILIKKKLDKKELSKKDLFDIIKDVVNNSLTESEIALFISAMYEQGTSFRETVYLIDAILESGTKLKLKNKVIADKHSIGGIPGNRTTPLVVSICAAAGLIMPKSSSRAITSAAGTADVLESIAKVDFSIKELKKIVQKTNACMIWGGAWGMVPADSKILKVEKMLKIDPEAQLLASIFSKKLASGSTHILIDIPYGKNAKVNKVRALKLKRHFKKLGKHYNLKIKVVLTDGSQPIGNGIGPILELNDVLDVLENKKNAPGDLKKKSLFLSGQLLELTNKAQKGKGIEMATSILSSGQALKKFKEIIKAQKGKVVRIKPGKFQKHIFSSRSCKIKQIHNKKISHLARITGAPSDKTAGIYLYHHKKEKIKKGEKILTLYSNSKMRLKQASDFYKKAKPIQVR